MPEFVLGFKALAELIPSVVGVPLENEHHNAVNGDSLQQTTKGLMVWRKQDNWTAFTNGYETWINGPLGLQQRLNTELFPWENDVPLVEAQDIIKLLPVAPWNELAVRPLSAIKLVGVHWDGGPSAFAEYNPVVYYQWEARYHISLDWGGGAHSYGIAYHEKISRDGRSWIVRPAKHIVWAARGANAIGYMICLDANEHSAVTVEQLTTLGSRLDAVRKKYAIPKNSIFGHGELVSYGNRTSCPGAEILSFIKDYRSS